MDCKGTLHATVKPNSNNCFYYNIWRFQFQYPYPGSCTLTSTWLSLGICYIMFGYIGAYFKAWHSCQPQHLRNWRPLWSRGPCHLQWRGSLRHSKVFQPQPAQRYPQVSQRPNVTTIRMKSSFPTKRQWFPTSMHLRGWLLHNSPGPNRAPLQHHRWPGSLCCQRVKERQLWLSQTGCQTQIPQMLAQEPFPIPMGPFKVIRGTHVEAEPFEADWDEIPDISDALAPRFKTHEHHLTPEAIRSRSKRIFTKRADGSKKVSDEIWNDWKSKGNKRRLLEDIFKRCGYDPETWFVT